MLTSSLLVVVTRHFANGLNSFNWTWNHVFCPQFATKSIKALVFLFNQFRLNGLGRICVMWWGFVFVCELFCVGRPVGLMEKACSDSFFFFILTYIYLSTSITKLIHLMCQMHHIVVSCRFAIKSSLSSQQIETKVKPIDFFFIYIGIIVVTRNLKILYSILRQNSSNQFLY